MDGLGRSALKAEGQFESKLRSARQLSWLYRDSMNSLQKYQTEAQRWKAVRQRDRQADGEFVYSVATTGVFCRPACPSRLALRKHISFHDSCLQAQQAGFRPCKRCKPWGPSQEKRDIEAATRACRLIEAADSLPSLTTLAKAVGLSPFHFHRIFKSVVGITPKTYAAQRQTEQVRVALRRQPSVTAAIYSAGFTSSSRFYERSMDNLGMTPTEFRAGGKGVQIRYTIAPCPLGFVLAAATERGICAIRLGSDPKALAAELRQDFPNSVVHAADPMLEKCVKTVVQQINSPNERVDLPLDIRGTAFQQRVWQALRQIPPGKTTTYSRLAEQIGQPDAVRAVAGACAANPVAVVIPCHRVVRSNGELSGYRWGPERKRQLLERERGLANQGKR